MRPMSLKFISARTIAINQQRSRNMYSFKYLKNTPCDRYDIELISTYYFFSLSDKLYSVIALNEV
jgi:hypothetical protein